ncbi:MAG: hypothetical protein KME07_21250 [Pegethrix bostrychoides GSE-TBD4-15B]|jgi:phosphoenolpyruvate synthase/pyruvate phosphate dikinase|uniref:Uncharacterized protein n=1 Tax=Pegethrix bostrychoides GSE-TBD4-15B TaxID=2839662 RepID=A0A951PFB8_9CYAN|nr:hypothetical protein [Pegethrix bostrychoides GSE-TBD4-15B]
MEPLSPQMVYNNLDQLDQTDVAASAEMRQQVQDLLADGEVSLDLRQEIAERLSQANSLLSRRTVTGGDSY